MKKILSIVAVMAAMTISASAQVFVGGSVGFGLTTGNNTATTAGISVETKDATNTSFQISPNVGYQFSDNFLIGGRLLYSLSSSKAYTPDTKSLSNGFNIAPYARYRFFEAKGFGFWGEANVCVGFSGTTKKTTAGDTEVSTKSSSISWALNVLPVITYSFNEHFTFEASVGCLNLGYKGNCTQNEDKTIKSVDHSLSVLGSSSLGTLSVGFTYKF